MIVFVRGRSGSGKTTLVEKMIGKLARLGYKVGAAKHAHSADEFDTPGKDSYRFRIAGADRVVVGGQGQAAVFFPAHPDKWTYDDVKDMVGDVDISLVEGFSHIPADVEMRVEDKRVTLSSDDGVYEYNYNDVSCIVEQLVEILRSEG